MHEKEPMTKTTYQKLSYELENLKTIERAKVAKEIEEARDLGDLREKHHLWIRLVTGGANRLACLSYFLFGDWRLG
ncbi:MAG: hypothetical protein KU38_12280 [Sulfurovum sp. FS08-3]|nr:MAG: hypothetical protein KU38_12280 [Sulfurovum sp. FS08-3]